MKKILFGILFFVLFFTGFARAESVKIAVIDIKKIVKESKYGQEIMQKLQKKYDEFSAEIQAKAKKLEELKKEIENKGSLWSKDVKQKKEEEYKKLLEQLTTLQEKAQYEMQEYQKQLLEPVLKKLVKVIKDYVKDKNYDLVLEKNQPGIYYASSRIDITSKILALFNKYYEETKTSKK